jgi:hypothetical protein
MAELSERREGWPATIVDLSALVQSSPEGENMYVLMTTEQEETYRGLYQDQAGTIGLEKVPSENRGDTGHRPNRFPGATLIERVVGFIESYKGSSYA